jgi:hypothetical protein
MDVASVRHDPVSCCFFGPEGVNPFSTSEAAKVFDCLQSHCKRSRWMQIVPLKHPKIFSVPCAVTLLKKVV